LKLNKAHFPEIKKLKYLKNNYVYTS